MAQDAEFLRQAREYDYYWANAFKKIDITPDDAVR